jgi:sialic acid synthase SpsE
MTKLFEASPFIIAEIGSNWTSFHEAKDSISFAKQAGADAVKFQAFKYDSLYGFDDRPEILKATPYPETNGTKELPLEWLPKLKEKADACGIEFMCSAFSPELVDAVDPFVTVHKVASSEMAYPQLLERVKSKGKPILLSVGASAKGDVSHALGILEGAQVVLMYCVAAYPSRYINLFQMADLQERFKVPIGFSDHSLDVVYPALSAYKHFGARVIEKHVNFTEHKTPDSGHSLNAYDFNFMCEVLHGKRPYIGFNPQPEERDMFLKHNRRLIAIKDIHVGDSFRYGDNFGSYRSLKEDSKGMIPFAWEVLVKSNGAKKFIKTGDGISVADFL